ncbi:putative GNAT superfamily acetyltransferase [Mumia flava]|uniref:Putative GNAT superfamily acetyltransferase n=1 Tax=Mumia flava TaxID=1348852 RepID=A0A0B2BPC0_9ACTN|nr:GNAT family N-acetyltransferase [Mumia flava]PJJ53689.1 putative GNAT superfamily acetyltransferase [Mumia flava]
MTMSDERVAPARTDPVVAEARAAAEALAERAGVRVRPLAQMEELEQVSDLFEEIWQPSGSLPVTAELMRALTKSGAYVGGAFDGEVLVGAAVGFFAPPAERAMHSHIAGVSERARGRHVGFALKVHQRAWALERDITEISWTFDPLVRRNASFNLARLAATGAEYLPNFYGAMDDEINGGDDTDRLLIRWTLSDPQVAVACRGQARTVDADAERAAGAALGLAAAPGGGPRAGSLRGGHASGTVLVGVPSDIEALRADRPDVAAQWRLALRETLGGLLAGGARIRGFDRTGYYVVDQEEAR